ncbi:MAG: MFS transporter [Pseudomonadota bacterium]
MTAKDNKLPLNFYILLISRLGSTFGSFLNMMAINIFLLELTKDPLWIAYAMGTRVISGIIAAPYSGYISDKVDRKKLMITSDLVLAVAVAFLLIVPESVIKYYVLFLMIFIGVFSNLFEINLRASIPSILNQKDTMKANSLLMGGMNLTFALSGLAAVFAYYLFKNYYPIFFLDSITYFISGIILFFIKLSTRPQIKSSQVLENQKTCSLFNKLKNDYSKLPNLNNFNIIIICLSILFLDAIASASHNIGFPVFSKDLDPQKPMFFYGLILMFWGLGNIIGIMFLNKAKFLKSLKAENLYLCFTAIMSAGMILIFQTNFIPIIIIAALIAGFGDGIYQTFYTSYIQKSEDAVRGKLFALTSLVLRTGFGIGFIIVPIIMKALPISTTVFLCHYPIVLISLLFITYFHTKHKTATLAQSSLNIALEL